MLAPLEFILSLRVFYDGSGKVHDPGCQFLNLGSYVGSDVAWKDFELRWLEILEQHSAPLSPLGKRYFHSKEAMHNQGGYAGWNARKVSALLLALTNLLGHMKRADPLALSCSVNLSDYRKVKVQIPKLRPPETICLDTCFGPVVRHPDRASGIDVRFDKGEKFFGILHKAWKQQKRGYGPWWAKYVTGIEEVEMRERPEIQAADLLAWLANRYRTHRSGDQWGSRFFGMFIVTKHYHEYIDEQALLSLFEPDGQMKAGVQLPVVEIKAPFVPERAGD